MRNPIAFVKCLAVISLVAVSAAHAIPNRISYQGLLNDENGIPVNGTVAFVFSIYDVPTGGTALWTENQTISVSNGVFGVQLGAIEPLPATLPANRTLFLGIQVGADEEMTPRQEIYSNPVDFRVPVGGIIAWTKSMSGTPDLADGWAECNGQILDDVDSPYHGQTLPNLNSQPQLLVGGTSSGPNRTEDYLPSHSHGSGTLRYRNNYGNAQGTTASVNCNGYVCGGDTGTKETGTPFSSYQVVWVIRVK